MKHKFYLTLLVAIVTLLPFWNVQAEEGTPISTYEELNTLVRADMNGTYYLTNDIVIPESTEWLPLGKPADWDGTTANLLVNFTGVLDGRGHSIKNLKIANAGNFSGLIARIADAEVRNLGLENVDIVGGAPTGALVGVIFGTAATSDLANTIENVFVTGSVKGTTEVGGLIGRNNNNPLNLIKNCYVNATVEATNATGAWAGGIVGCNNSGRMLTLKQVYATGVVKTTALDVTNFAGGIIGYVNNNNANTTITLDSTVVALNELAGGTNGIILNRGKLAGTVTLNDNYASNDLGITETTDATLVSPSDILSQNLYETTLGWDFENVWTKVDGASLPTFSWKNLETSVIQPNDKQSWSIRSSDTGVSITTAESLSVAVFDITGKIIYSGSVNNQLLLPLNKGVYVFKVNSGANVSNRKVLVY